MKAGHADLKVLMEEWRQGGIPPAKMLRRLRPVCDVLYCEPVALVQEAEELLNLAFAIGDGTLSSSDVLKRLEDIERSVCIELHAAQAIEPTGPVADPVADPMAEMWRELEAYQPQADKNGHGETWKAACRRRTQVAAEWAAMSPAMAAASAAASDDARRALAAAAMAVVTGDNAYARLAIDEIRRAKEAKP
jgi:hypothetical protein